MAKYINPYRQVWLVYYRLERIVKRESAKAYSDAILYGIGCVKVDDNGEAQHISIDEIYING